MQPTRIDDFMPAGEFLAVALELSSGSRKIGLHDGKREKPAIHTVSANSAACRLEQVVQQIVEVKSRWGLAPHVRTGRAVRSRPGRFLDSAGPVEARL